MDEKKLDNAISSIAADIGPDAAEFTPPGQKNFLVEAALGSMAANFLFAFFKAIAGKAAETAQQKIGEKLGDTVADACSNLIDRLRHKTPPASTADVKTAADTAAAAIKQQGLSPAELQAISAAVADAMANALSVRSNPDVSRRVADTVSSEGMQALS